MLILYFIQRSFFYTHLETLRSDNSLIDFTRQFDKINLKSKSVESLINIQIKQLQRTKRPESSVIQPASASEATKPTNRTTSKSFTTW